MRLAADWSDAVRLAHAAEPGEDASAGHRFWASVCGLGKSANLRDDTPTSCECILHSHRRADTLVSDLSQSCRNGQPGSADGWKETANQTDNRREQNRSR